MRYAATHHLHEFGMPICPASVNVIGREKGIPVSIRDHGVSKLVISKVIPPYFPIIGVKIAALKLKQPNLG